jgi:hypothetical protein
VRNCSNQLAEDYQLSKRKLDYPPLRPSLLELVQPRLPSPLPMDVDQDQLYDGLLQLLQDWTGLRVTTDVLRKKGLLVEADLSL